MGNQRWQSYPRKSASRDFGGYGNHGINQCKWFKAQAWEACKLFTIHNMVAVGNVLVHEYIVKNDFVCNLNKCKGICCVEGDSGAPLNEKETEILREIYPKVEPY